MRSVNNKHTFYAFCKQKSIKLTHNTEIEFSRPHIPYQKYFCGFQLRLLLESSKKAKLLRYHHVSAMGERRYSSYSLFNLALDGVSGQRHAPAALYPQERTTGTHWIGGWVGLRAGLDTEVNEKILCFCRGSNLGRPDCGQTLYWLSYRSSIGV
jgi:hypothetical protein